MLFVPKNPTTFSAQAISDCSLTSASGCQETARDAAVSSIHPKQKLTVGHSPRRSLRTLCFAGTELEALYGGSHVCLVTDTQAVPGSLRALPSAKVRDGSLRGASAAAPICTWRLCLVALDIGVPDPPFPPSQLTGTVPWGHRGAEPVGEATGSSESSARWCEDGGCHTDRVREGFVV